MPEPGCGSVPGSPGTPSGRSLAEARAALGRLGRWDTPPFVLSLTGELMTSSPQGPPRPSVAAEHYKMYRRQTRWAPWCLCGAEKVIPEGARGLVLTTPPLVVSGARRGVGIGEFS